MIASPIKPLAYSYVRMSTDAQQKGDSLRRQTELSKAYAERSGLTLVEDFKLHDIGVSAFKGDNAATGALRRFLEAVENGKILQGSYLLVESLDRLSRDKITSAMQLFLSITEGGVNIVTLSDNQVYRAGQTDFPQLVYSMAIMSRANEESRIKSQRVGAAWKNKQVLASTKKLTAMVPSWLRLSDDRSRFDLIDERVEVVRRIYRMASEGYGTYSITATLNREAVPAFGRSKGWNDSYVEKILKNRAVLGEYQPHSKTDGIRRPVGDPVSGYNPAIITEDLFLSVQADRRKRGTYGGGRKGVELKNLFTHIATCAYCGAPMRMVDKGRGPKGGRYLKCSAGVRGMGCTKKGWRYDDFERSFLFLAREVDLAGVMNAEAASKAAADLDQRIAAAVEKLARLQTQRERFAELASDPTVGIDFIRDKLASVQSDLTETTALLGKLRDEKRAVETPAADPDDIKRLIDDLKQMSGPAAYEHRTRLANRLRSIVQSLTVAVEGEKQRLAKARQLLDDSGTEADFRDQVLARIEEVAKANQSYNPGFKVTFADGIIRQATVTTSDPMQYVAESVVRPDGTVEVEIAARPGYQNVLREATGAAAS